MDTEHLKEQAGPIGRELANALAEHVTEATNGFPDSSPAQRAAIARLAAGQIEDYAVAEDGNGLD